MLEVSAKGNRGQVDLKESDASVEREEVTGMDASGIVEGTEDVDPAG